MAEWISVKDRLPEDGKYVLVWEPNLNAIDFSRYDKASDYWIDHEYNAMFPSHWMPLPPPPKGE